MKPLAAALLVVLATALTPAAAQTESSVTLYGGYRAGGHFTDVTTGSRWEVTDGSAYALGVDLGIDSQRQAELFISHRRAALKASGFSPAANNIGLDITYYHLGGTYFPGKVSEGFFVAGGIGATQLTPHEAGLNSETKLSLNVGAGYLIPFGRHMGIKLEARGYGTLLNGSGGLFCSGGCVVQIKGSTLTQGELLAGFSARF